MSNDIYSELDEIVYEEAGQAVYPLHKLAKDISGQRFGRLVALKPVARNRHHRVIWECLCDCGNHTSVVGVDLRDGKTKSCGCYNTEVAKRRATKHGMHGTRIYSTWQGMLTRCLNPGANNYHNYGGRGISVCARWRESFDDFHFYVAQIPHFDEEGYTLDRINNDGDYEPGNVRWATRKEQAENRRVISRKRVENHERYLR